MKDKNSQKKTDSVNNEASLPTDDETKQILRNALASFLKEKIDEKNFSKKNIEALIGVVEEFLNSFIILGYTFDGTPVQYICAHTQQQADSLATLVNKFFQHAVMGDDEDF
jgi:hypothetical protein